MKITPSFYRFSAIKFSGNDERIQRKRGQAGTPPDKAEQIALAGLDRAGTASDSGRTAHEEDAADKALRRAGDPKRTIR